MDLSVCTEPFNHFHKQGFSMPDAFLHCILNNRTGHEGDAFNRMDSQEVIFPQLGFFSPVVLKDAKKKEHF